MTTHRRPPLEGIRVLDLSRLLPGPFLTLMMAEMGAEVIRIEDPQGSDWARLMPPVVEHGTLADGQARELGAAFVLLNRGKRSMCLDLKAEAGRELFLRLCEKVDVVVESFRPGVMARLGLDWETLKARNSKLVLCSISGYGQDGPLRDRAGHDLNYIALAGLLGLGGAPTTIDAGPKGPPVMPGGQVADIAGGALFGLSSTLAALFGRERHGEGAHLDISMAEGAMSIGMMQLAPTLAGSPAAVQGGEPLTGGVPCYGVYPTKDGGHMSLAALEPKFWMAFCAAVERPDLLDQALASGDDAEVVRATLSELFQSRTRDEWVALLADVECCCEPVLGTDELTTHPLYVARGTFGDAHGLRLHTPVSRGLNCELGPAPAHGEHTEVLLRSVGLSDAEIEALS